ncbi:hypothetical protein VSU19_04175, partial [Verrucomicrobiales bacterium BCK34]|nr:hypothetical protein [Verrucomicrobiales bacterium BCK34]
RVLSTGGLGERRGRGTGDGGRGTDGLRATFLGNAATLAFGWDYLRRYALRSFLWQISSLRGAAIRFESTKGGGLPLRTLPAGLVYVKRA